MDDKLKSRLATLTEVLREYEPMMEKWQKVSAFVENTLANGFVVNIKYSREIIKTIAGETGTYPQSQIMEIPYTIEEIDKMIDRIRKRIEYKK